MIRLRQAFGTFLLGLSILATLNVRGASMDVPLLQDVYIWQRAWTDDLRHAAALSATNFHRILVLNAEITWTHLQPRVTRIPIDYAALAALGRPIGLALRIGPYPGPFASTGPPVETILHTASSLCRDAAQHRLPLVEVQLDFDCAESKLAGYRTWVEAIRKEVAPTPVTITALPSWLAQPEFTNLVSSASNYVLQVHSLERPRKRAASFSLCDPSAALRAVERAGKFGVPFRVALPTYGYIVAFDRAGQFIGLAAEGPLRTWPDSVQTEEVRANPQQIAHLVKEWTTHPPNGCTGLIWYRLPVKTDALNWPWPTLAAVMQGREPRVSVRLEIKQRSSALFDLNLVNDGESDRTFPKQIAIEWRQGRLVAGDGLQGYELAPQEKDLAATFRRVEAQKRCPAGTTIPIGWLRLDTDQEIHAEIRE